MANNDNNSLTSELTGETNTKTDQGGLSLGSLIVLLLDGVLLIYTAWRSYDFLTTTIPSGFQLLALAGLVGLDIGAVGWSLAWIIGATSQYQDWAAMSFFIIDLLGVILTSLTDSLMYGAKGGAMTTMLAGIAVVMIPLVVVGNVVGGFIFHMTSPETKAHREERKALAEHKRKMREVAAMERDANHAEKYILARQDILDKSVLLAEIKTAQDALEKATRAKLRDQIGIQQKASALTGGNGNGEDKLAAMKTRLADLKARLSASTDSDDVPAQQQTPAKQKADPIPYPIQTPPMSPLSPADPELEAITGAPSSEAVKGNGHSHTNPI
jgi:hypothetical protein